jgi:hypothetical protein
MVKLYLAAAVTVLAALFGPSAFAQAYYRPGTQPPPPVPMSAPHAQARAIELDRCAKEVAKARDNVGLRIQQWNGAESRALMNAELDTAANAAAAGDEQACWHWYDRAQQTMR